ncbi:MAG: hypothetical protein LBD20_04945 [Spirochaetaceae bacterium]|nr:hypothetical protein [Spirochaetaceae bacterium]
MPLGLCKALRALAAGVRRYYAVHQQAQKSPRMAIFEPLSGGALRGCCNTEPRLNPRMGGSGRRRVKRRLERGGHPPL